VIGVDMPSGVNTDTGEVANVAVSCDLTVTFAYPKWGHFLYPGADYRGELCVKDISLYPPTALSLRDALVTKQMAAAYIPQRKNNSHKGSYGHCLIVAGSKQMIGASLLAATGCYRSGAGLVTLAIPECIFPAVSARIVEPIIWLWPFEDGHFSQDSWQMLPNANREFNCLAIGPGIGQWPEGEKWLKNVCLSTHVPIVLDADALNLLARDKGWLKTRKQPVILTPHPKEMARLCGISVNEVQKNRPAITREFAVENQVYVVLKGNYTIIAAPDGRVFVNTSGSSALAKGGTGDVLTGMIAAFVATNSDILSGIISAVFVHGLAGELAGEECEHSVLASDVANQIGRAIGMLRDKIR
jgi:NAD(P)H-hydrate epimerase